MIELKAPIDPKRHYSMSEMSMLTGINYVTLRRYADKGLIKVTTIGTGKSCRYSIMGKFIIDFIANYDDQSI